MSQAFERDPYPGAPRILFVGLAESTHTHAWIDLLADARVNVRLFAMPSGMPPDAWPVKTYVTAPRFVAPGSATRLRAASSPLRRIRDRLRRRPTELTHRLGTVLRHWQPHVVHSLGLDPASFLMDTVRRDPEFEAIGRWLAQSRGGPELTLHHRLPEYAERIRSVVLHCDEFLADNKVNYEIATKLGLDPERKSPLGVMPGTGGVAIDALRERGALPPSQRPRLVVWPKAYECPASKALPVLEALRLSWERLRPCEIVMFAAIPEVRMWMKTLPEEIQKSCKIHDRIPRDEVLDWMARARVMLAPSLTDGIPNTLYEAMAAGAAPIVSPIETLVHEVVADRHVLFARNLHPPEIGDALVRALDEDALVDGMYRENLVRVRQLADRHAIAARVAQNYLRLAGSAA